MRFFDLSLPSLNRAAFSFAPRNETPPVLVIDASAYIEFIRYLKKGQAVSVEVLDAAEISMSNMRKNLKARVGAQKSMRADADSKVIISGEDLEQFYASAKCKAAEKLLEEGVPNIKIRDILNVRNYLIAALILENYCRPASIYRLNVASVKESKVKHYPSFY